MINLCLIGAYAISVVIGWAISGAAMLGMRKSLSEEVGQKGLDKPSFTLKDLYIGGTERSIAITLTIFAPKFLPGFIGAWVALKIAANWKRKSGEEYSTANLLALIGSAISFSIAIAAGLMVNPEALNIWNPPGSVGVIAAGK